VKSPLRIGFLPFYVDYYEAISSDFAPRKRALIRQCRETLAAYGEVVGPEDPLMDKEAAAAVGATMRREGVDCVVALTVIAVFSGLSDAAIRQLDAPLLLWHCQEIDTVDADYSMVEIVRNTGQIGVQALANVLGRRRREFRVLCASRQAPQTSAGLEDFFAVARARRALSGGSVLQIGEPFPDMTDVLLPEPHAAALGLHIVKHSAEDLTRTYLAVPDDEARDEVASMRRDFTAADITEEELLRSARIWLAVKSLLGGLHPVCATINSHGVNGLRNPEIGLTATYAISRLHAMGIPCSEVGDIPTAMALRILCELAGDALYTEVQVLDEVRRAIVLANSGEAADGLRAPGSPVRMLGNANFRGLHGRGASFAYPIAPGPATVVSLTPVGESGFRLVAMEGEILEEPLPDTGAITGFFRFSHTTLHDGYRRWIEAGPVHHAATAHGHHADRLRSLARLMGWEIVAI
jgi:L-arabinose isomerase